MLMSGTLKRENNMSQSIILVTRVAKCLWPQARKAYKYRYNLPVPQFTENVVFQMFLSLTAVVKVDQQYRSQYKVILLYMDVKRTKKSIKSLADAGNTGYAGVT
jgi:hypothetical protein